MQAIRDVAPAPPVAARSLAIVHTAMYDAWTAYTPLAVSTAGDPQVRRPSREWTEANKGEAVSYAAFAALRDQFPTREADVEAIMTRMGYDPGDRHVDDVTPAGIGNAAAAAVLAVRHQDGSNQLGDLTPSGKPYADYTGYVPANSPERVDDPDRWQPLRLPNGTVRDVLGSAVGTRPSVRAAAGIAVPAACARPSGQRRTAPRSTNSSRSVPV